jgi:hypothetical protein
VLFGIERLRKQDRPRYVDGYGWLAWFDGESLHVERRTCWYADPV